MNKNAKASIKQTTPNAKNNAFILLEELPFSVSRRLITFIPITGNTQGIKLRIIPPKKAKDNTMNKLFSFKLFTS